MKDTKNLQPIREQIDAIDAQLQTLIAERAALAQQVATVKMGEGEQTHFYRPEREAEILKRVQARNQGPLSDAEMLRLFREIMSACLALEAPLRVAFLGPEGTYTQEACQKHFGQSVVNVPATSIGAVFREVESGAVHYGVVPIENSTEGVVHYTLDQFVHSTLCISGEVELRIHHQLLSRCAQLDQITSVYSHEQSFGQCRHWLDTHLQSAQRITVSSNAEAAQRAAKDPTSAAIASASAGQLYGLDTLASKIEDEPNNTTRFLVIGQKTVAPTGNDKTSILLSTKNAPGALYQLLAPLAKRGITMTRIESRPSRRETWDYVFFIDIDGHVEDENLALAMQELKASASFLKVLGSYPKAIF